MKPWYCVSNAGHISSPALLVYPERIAENIRRIISVAGGVERLRPHVKTHKMSRVMQMQLAAGIRKFKCATLAEAEMVARCGADDVLWAYQAVGPNVQRLVRLACDYPATKFSALVDDHAALEQISIAASAAQVEIGVLLDLDVGFGRTGVQPSEAAAPLYRAISNSPGIRAAGLHVYDGQIRHTDLDQRRAACDAAMVPVIAFRKQLQQAGLRVPTIVAGGTPTFPLHAEHADRECSPGTCVLWDASYATKFPDLDFQWAAVVLSRVVSKPAANRLCLDLGYKAVASDNPDPRVIWPDLPDAKTLVHSEEHLLLQSEHADRFSLGDVLYGIPWHICPTVALYPSAIAVVDGRAGEAWKVDARDRGPLLS